MTTLIHSGSRVAQAFLPVLFHGTRFTGHRSRTFGMTVAGAKPPGGHEVSCPYKTKDGEVNSPLQEKSPVSRPALRQGRSRRDKFQPVLRRQEQRRKSGHDLSCPYKTEDGEVPVRQAQGKNSPLQEAQERERREIGKWEREEGEEKTPTLRSYRRPPDQPPLETAD
jgi:hypothetical protein